MHPIPRCNTHVTVDQLLPCNEKTLQRLRYSILVAGMVAVIVVRAIVHGIAYTIIATLIFALAFTLNTIIIARVRSAG